MLPVYGTAKQKAKALKTFQAQKSDRLAKLAAMAGPFVVNAAIPPPRRSARTRQTDE